MDAGHTDSLNGLAELQKTVARALEPYSALSARLVPVLSEISEKIRPATKALTDFAKVADGFRDWFLETAQPLREMAARLARVERVCGAVEALGWLPHHTLPNKIFSEDLIEADLHEEIRRHYEDNWEEIKCGMQNRVKKLLIDDEAKAVFEEALYLHSVGLYRSVVRLLFPEIERVSRIEIHGNSLKAKITSQREIREICLKLSISDFGGVGFSAFRFYKILENHLYAKVEDDDSKNRMSSHAVPNRHAALHGIVCYSTSNNSINAIMMTEFVFSIISLNKEYGAE